MSWWQAEIPENERRIPVVLSGQTFGHVIVWRHQKYRESSFYIPEVEGLTPAFSVPVHFPERWAYRVIVKDNDEHVVLLRRYLSSYEEAEMRGLEAAKTFFVDSFEGFMKDMARPL